MDKAGKKSVRAFAIIVGASAVIAAVIATVMFVQMPDIGVRGYVALLLFLALVLSVPSSVLFAVGKVMDEAGGKSDRAFLVIIGSSAAIAAVIATVMFVQMPDMGVGIYVVLLLAFAGFLSVPSALFFAVGKMMDGTGAKSLRASLATATLIAAVLYVADAFILLHEFFDYVLFGAVLLYFLPGTLSALRRDRRVAGLRAAKAGVCLLAVVLIVGHRQVAEQDGEW